MAVDPVKVNQGQVDGDDVKPMCWYTWLTFGNDLEIDGDVLAAKRSREDDDTFGGESGGTSGTSASTESDADVVPEQRRRRGFHHKPRPPRKNNPSAFVQLSPTLQ